MLEINPRNARTWARIGVRASYGMAMLEAVRHKPQVIAMSADLGRSSGFGPLMAQFPEQFVNVGIAEQNMVGVAAGMVREGFDVFASSFAPFVSMRASEQVRMNLGYMEIPVKLVALGSGVAMGFLGNSHYGLEDMAVMRTIPGLTLISPADCAEVFKVVQACLDYPHPVYIRLTGSVNAPVVYDAEYEFRIGRAHVLRDGSDLCLVAAGSMVAVALAVADDLQSSAGIQAAVVNMHTLKPLDEACLEEQCQRSSLIVTLEEHSIIGGLGSAVAEWRSRRNVSNRHVAIGIQDTFLKTGNYAYALHEAGLSKEKVLEKIKSELPAAAI